MHYVRDAFVVCPSLLTLRHPDTPQRDAFLTRVQSMRVHEEPGERSKSC
ncbi:hypothetical protein BSU04_21865 [Caballeronia sordidicola]|uniref:Uncharacterized protein n=1 Tax=Caballeronia sordidicola TaxID=196367 RepID=A0A226WYQ0_CABSO|nr:hypothetical protein BSU04_21865 [Caballeronia sordidicola]